MLAPPPGTGPQPEPCVSHERPRGRGEDWAPCLVRPASTMPAPSALVAQCTSQSRRFRQPQQQAVPGVACCAAARAGAGAYAGVGAQGCRRLARGRPALQGTFGGMLVFKGPHRDCHRTVPTRNGPGVLRHRRLPWHDAGVSNACVHPRGRPGPCLGPCCSRPAATQQVLVAAASPACM